MISRASGGRDTAWGCLFLVRAGGRLQTEKSSLKFGPPHAGYFAAALPGEQQQLHDRPEREADLVAGLPQCPYLGVAQDPCAGRRRLRPKHPEGRVDRDQAVLGRPREELAEGRGHRPSARIAGIAVDARLSCRGCRCVSTRRRRRGSRQPRCRRSAWQPIVGRDRPPAALARHRLSGSRGQELSPCLASRGFSVGRGPR